MSARDSSERITKAILQKCVANDKQVTPEVVEIERFEVVRGAAVGDNYATDIKAVEVKAKVAGQQYERGYIAKLFPTDIARIQMLGDMPIFLSECYFYGTLSKELQALRKEAKLSPFTLAKTFYESNEDGVIMFENLKDKGFEAPAKCVTGLSNNEVDLILIALAEYHATTYHFLQKYKGGAAKFVKDHPYYDTKTFYDMMTTDEARKMQKEWFNQIFDTAITTLKEVRKDGGQDLADKVEGFKKIWRNVSIDAATPKTTDFTTLIHGDMWYKNVMFKYSKEGNCIDTNLIDFQVITLANPGVDLNYFMSSSVHPNVQRVHAHSWLRLYHTVLVKNMGIFGYPETTYKFEHLEADYKRARNHGFTTGLMHTVGLLLTADSEVGKQMDLSSEENRGKSMDEIVTENNKLGDILTQSLRIYPEVAERVACMIELAVEDGLI